MESRKKENIVNTRFKSVQGPDDYESMREVVRRRYSRVLKEGLPLPDLIIIDGGKGHVEAVRDILENELGLDIPLAGLVKDEKHRTSQLLMGNPLEMVDLDRRSQEFYLLQRIQDEVHRFAITFHRQLRGKNAIHSLLDDVPGVGEKRRKQLLKHFGSFKKMKEATIEEIRRSRNASKCSNSNFPKISGVTLIQNYPYGILLRNFKHKN